MRNQLGNGGTSPYRDTWKQNNGIWGFGAKNHPDLQEIEVGICRNGKKIGKQRILNTRRGWLALYETII